MHGHLLRHFTRPTAVGRHLIIRGAVGVSILFCFLAILWQTKYLRPLPAIAHKTMHIKHIPMWTGSQDNYAYLIVDDKTKDAMIVDPANPPEVLPVLKRMVNEGSIKLKAIINTHHHNDHAGGNDRIREEYPDLPIIGGKDCQSVTKTPADNETFNIGENIQVKALHTPCHTQDSICYFVNDGEDKAVFTGDTLFIAGCGRMFEGTADEMHKALGRLAGLPKETKVYPGHEYTKNNAKFAKTVLDSVWIQKLAAYCDEHKETTGKFTIEDELRHNVFMKVTEPELQQATGELDPVSVFAKLRSSKDNFKG